jgi:hypothetical protein
MAWRKGHGNGAGVPRIETLPADELPDGVAAPSGPVIDRYPSGKVPPGPSAQALGRLGGLAKKESRELNALIGLWQPPEGHTAHQYLHVARVWRDEHAARLAQTVGGGTCGPGPSSIVATSALQLAASRILFDEGFRTNNPKLLLEASRLANDSGQNLLAAHELSAKEAQSNAADMLLPWERPEFIAKKAAEAKAKLDAKAIEGEFE